MNTKRCPLVIMYFDNEQSFYVRINEYFLKVPTAEHVYVDMFVVKKYYTCSGRVMSKRIVSRIITRDVPYNIQSECMKCNQTIGCEEVDPDGCYYKICIKYPIHVSDVPLVFI